MTIEAVRHFALRFPGATEEPHFDRTSFRARGKIFATAKPGDEYLNVFVSEEEGDRALSEEPDFLERLFWGDKTVGLRVLLPAAKPDFVHGLLTQAWLRRTAKRNLTAYRADLARPNPSKGETSAKLR